MNSVLYLCLIVAAFKTRFAEGEGNVRLRDGVSPLEGRVEVFVGEEWGVIVDNSWDIRDALVICRQLGYLQAKGILSNLDISPPLQVKVTNVQCRGHESSLLHCPHMMPQDQVFHQETKAVGVICAIEFSLRLVDGIGDSHGLLEILNNAGEWQGVCSDTWDDNDATVACRQLGYQQFINNSYASSTSNAVSTVSANCSGDEFHLQGCASFQIVDSNACNSGQNVILGCVGAPTAPQSPRVLNWTCTSLSLTWREPDIRGSPITHYTIRYRLRYGSSPAVVWREVQVNNVSANVLQMSALQNLVHSSLYEIQISASNVIGSSSYSDVVFVWTLSPDIQPPMVLESHSITSTSASFHWNVLDHCIGTISGYEAIYYLLDSPEEQTFQFVPHTSLNATQASLIIDGLAPYRMYGLQVRAVGNNSEGQKFVSSLSQERTFMTRVGAPDGTPQSFTGYLSQLRKSIKFRWSAVDAREANGALVGYNLHCNYSSETFSSTETRNFGNDTFQFELDNIVGNATYECAISASTSAGQGPNTTAIIFTTPDLNTPRPPYNVAYALINPMDSDRETLMVQAMWTLSECYHINFNSNCIDILGYVIECRSNNRDEEEIRKIIWRDEIDLDQNQSFGMATFLAKPFRTYQCQMAAINGNGVGLYGSKKDVMTPQQSPMQAPMHLYASKIQPFSVTINWRYDENPPVGDVVGFYISYYLQDQRDPSLNGEPIRENLLHSVNNANQMDFSYVIDEYLSSGTSYNVYVAAITDIIYGGGNGPEASISFTTQRIAPSLAPSMLQGTYDILTKPHALHATFSWTYSIGDREDPSLLGGFILHCYNSISNSTTVDVSSHVYLQSRSSAVSSEPEQYSLSVLQHATCTSPISSYTCDVRAFNEEGEGPRSSPTTVYPPCSSESGGLQDTFLANAYVGVVLLVLVLLLIAAVSIVTFMLCYYIRQNCLNQRIIAGKIDTYSSDEVYDDGYINMAPSGAAVKPFANGRNGNLPLPPGVNLHLMGESTDDSYNLYDRIPADRTTKGDNLYDEINLQGARMLSGAHVRLTSSNGTGPGVRGNMSKHELQTSEIEDSQVTMVTLLASQGPAPSDVDVNEQKLNELQRALSISPSQSTDYIEMSGAVGKKMGKAERNLHDRSGTSLSNHSSLGSTPKRAKYNPYSYKTSADPSKPRQVNETTSNAQPLPDAETQFRRLSIKSNNSAGVGNNVERLCNGQDEANQHVPQAENPPTTTTPEESL